jgi:SPP1 gp7 family putative phage head morphogenesis protein
MLRFDLNALPIDEALAFWRDKAPMSRADFDELAEAQRARAFMVSGLNRLDQVGEVQEALYQALAKGETFAEFKARIPHIVKQQNWSGVRLDIIYRTNVQAAYMAGRYAQMMKVKATRPYWMYDAVNDHRTRPAHRELDGKIFSADHPFWNEWMPPNGYRCRCGVTTVSSRELKRDGLKVETEDPTGKPFAPIDPRTGGKLPARLLMPDPGFSGNVGKDWLQGLAPSELDGKIKALAIPGLPAGTTLCRDGKGLFSDGDPCRPPLAGIDRRHIAPFSAEDLLPSGLAPERYVAAFLAECGLAGIDASRVVTLPGGIPVAVSKGFFVDRASGAWKVTKQGRERYLRLLARTILDPYEIWQVPAEVAGKKTPVLRLLRLFSEAGGGGLVGGFAVFNLVRGRQWQATTAFAPKLRQDRKALLDYLERQRAGVLLYREALPDGHE